MNAYSEVVIFYFSGTGNSQRVAKWICELSAARNIDCKMLNISNMGVNQLKPIDSNALIIIISPIHGFNYPKITLQFISNFPIGVNKIILMNTRAGMKLGRFITPGLTGIAFIISSLIFISKGYIIVGQIPFDMPSNWISIHPALNERSVKFIHQKNYERVKKHTDKILAGKKDFIALRDMLQDILISPVALGYYLGGRYIIAKTFYASYKCDNCGLCIKQCPVKAIENINDHPYWKFRCESCMKCMNSCPKRGIETAHGLFILILIFISIFSSTVITPFLSFGNSNGLIMFVIDNVLLVGLLFMFYHLQHFMIKKKYIRRLIAFTSLTYYKFWGRYKSIPDYKWKR